MSDQKNNINIEDAINSKLSQSSRENALDFVGFLRANGLLLDSNGDGGGWAVGGTVGNSVGYMMVSGGSEFPGPWTVWLNSCDFDGANADDELKETAWSHASPCGRCHKGWKDCGGGDRVIFGRKFENLCHSPLMFTDPDAQTLSDVKKLMLILGQSVSDK